MSRRGSHKQPESRARAVRSCVVRTARSDELMRSFLSYRRPPISGILSSVATTDIRFPLHWNNRFGAAKRIELPSFRLGLARFHINVWNLGRLPVYRHSAADSDRPAVVYPLPTGSCREGKNASRASLLESPSRTSHPTCEDQCTGLN